MRGRAAPLGLLVCVATALLAAPPLPVRAPQEPELRAWPALTAGPAERGAISWEQAAAHVGETVTVRGKVARTHRGDRVVHLNFKREWQGTFQVVIFASAWCEFPAPPEEWFREREILVSGKVKDYKGTPEIVVDRADAIRILGAAPAAAVPVAGARPARPERQPGVVVATWNLQNFFDGWDDPYREDEQTEPASVSPGRRRRIADALIALDADLICLQEVENRFALEEFVAAYVPDLGYEVVLVEGNDARGIDVALLTRLPIESVTSHRQREFRDAADGAVRFARDLLRVRVGAPLQADVFVVHLKSQQGGASADVKREAEAREIAAIVRAELTRDARWRALVAGDFNAVADEPTLGAFLAPRADGGAGLVDACAGSDAPTYHREPHVSRIDYVLLTPALAAELREGAVRDALPGVDLRCASDHFPVRVRLAPR